MGPKKKEGKVQKADEEKSKNEPKKSVPEFLTKDRKKLKKESKERGCFSFIIHKEESEELTCRQRCAFSLPDIPYRESKTKWPPLEIFTPDNNYEVPRITMWKPFTKDHIKCMEKLDEAETLTYIENILPAEYSALNKHFIKYLIYDIHRWAKKYELDDKKISCVLGMYLNTHNYFLGSTRRNQRDIYNFFKTSILLHTINDPPKSTDILKPHECKLGLLYFCHTYLPMLPLLRVRLLPNYRLKLHTAAHK